VIESFFTARTDARGFAFARIFVGAAALLRAPVSYHLFDNVLRPGVLQARAYEWLPAVSRDWMAGYILLWAAAAFSFMVGYRTRFSGGLLCALIAYHLAADQNFFASHVFFLLHVVLLLTIGNSGAVLSVDWFRRGRLPGEVLAWPVHLLKLQVSIIYFFAAVLKLNPGFISGDRLRDALKVTETSSGMDWVWWLSAATIALEFYLSFALWSRRLRPTAILMGVGFHAAIPLSMGLYGGLIVFSTTIVGTYWAYLSTREIDWLHNRLEAVAGRPIPRVLRPG